MTDSSSLAKEMDKSLCQVQLYFNESLNYISNDVKVNHLLLWAGDEGQERNDVFDFSKEAKDPNNYTDRFWAY